MKGIFFVQFTDGNFFVERVKEHIDGNLYTNMKTRQINWVLYTIDNFKQLSKKVSKCKTKNLQTKETEFLNMRIAGPILKTIKMLGKKKVCHILRVMCHMLHVRCHVSTIDSRCLPCLLSELCQLRLFCTLQSSLDEGTNRQTHSITHTSTDMVTYRLNHPGPIK